MTKFLIIILIFLYSISFGMDNSAKLKDIKIKITAQEKELKKLQSKSSDILAKVKLIQNKQANESRAVKILQDEINSNNKKLNLLSLEIMSLEAQKEESAGAIQKGMVFLTDNAGVFTIRTILTDADFYDITSASEIISVMNAEIVTKIDEYNKISATLENARKVMEAENVRLNANMSERRRISSNYATSKKELDAALAALKKDEQKNRKYIQELEKEQNRLNKAIKDNINKGSQLGSGVFAKLRGKLDMPLKGKIFESFGKRHITEANVTIDHKGIKIKPVGDGKVYTPANGKVLFVDYINGMENVIIIQYDDDYYIVYANMDEFVVNEGDKLNKGDNIGRIDVDLKRDSAYLYLEVRYHELAVDPSLWFKKS